MKSDDKLFEKQTAGADEQPRHEEEAKTLPRRHLPLGNLFREDDDLSDTSLGHCIAPMTVMPCAGISDATLRRISSTLGRINRTKYNPADYERESSLNNFDYARLQGEVVRLRKAVGNEDFESMMPALSAIMAEAEGNKDSDYPGRRFPYNNKRGREAWRYICLRIIDELLYTADYNVTDDEVWSHISKKVKELNILLPPKIRKNLSDRIGENPMKGSLPKMYGTLASMITAEFDFGQAARHDRSAFAPGVKGGHRYATVETPQGNVRVMAFMLQYSNDESKRIDSETSQLIATHFEGDREEFANAYPVIASMAGSFEIALSASKNKDVGANVTTVKYSDMMIVNNQIQRLPDVKKRVEDAIKMNLPLPVKDGEIWKLYYPLEIRDKGNSWVVVAVELPARNSLTILPGECFVDAFNGSFESAMRENAMESTDKILGVGELADGKAWNVTLYMTHKKRESLLPSTSRLLKLNPVIYDKEFRIDLTVYPNEDFFEELLYLDRNAQLVDIEPANVREWYDDYYFRHEGKARVPYEERKANKKVTIQRTSHSHNVE